MRRIGNTLLWTGALVGVVSGVWLWFGPAAGGLPLFVGIGLIKLTLAAGLGLIASGAVALRLANRADLRRQLGDADSEVVITGDRKASRKDARLKG